MPDQLRCIVRAAERKRFYRRPLLAWNPQLRSPWQKIIDVGHDEWREEDQLAQPGFGNFSQVERDCVYIIDRLESQGTGLGPNRWVQNRNRNHD